MQCQRSLRVGTIRGRHFSYQDKWRPEHRVGIAGRHLAGSGVDQAWAVNQCQDGLPQGLRAAQQAFGLLAGEDPGGEMPGRGGFNRPQADQ